jgi:hypothetical protein
VTRVFRGAWLVVAVLNVATSGCSAASPATLNSNPAPALPEAWVDLPDSPVTTIQSGPGFVLENRTAIRISTWSVGCVREANGVVTIVAPLWDVTSSGSWTRGFPNRAVFDDLNKLDADPELYTRIAISMRPCQLGTRAALTNVGSQDGYKWSAEGTTWPRESKTGVQRPPLERLLIDALKVRNPRIARSMIVELRPLGNSGGQYVLLGWGIRSDGKFEGTLEDELYGLFVLDNALMKIERTLDTFPPPRWNDYLFRFEKTSKNEVVLVGTAGSDGHKVRRVYDLHKFP